MTAIEPGDSYDLDHFRADALALDAAPFVAKHGPAFLLMSAENTDGLQLPSGPRQTMAVDERTVSDSWRPSRYRVWPIRKSDRSLIGRFVSVGRTRRNDVVIPDVSLSKFHAFFIEEAGTFHLQDARSRNGTLVDGVPVSAQGDGKPTPLRPGARIRLGAVSFLFLDAAALQKLVRDLVRRS